jgi:SAM-dependent methyltransferase
MRQSLTGRSQVRVVALGALVAIATFAVGAQSSQTQTAEEVRSRWNAAFAEGAPALDRAPSRLLVESVRGRAPGTALDLGSGQGRNALFLAEAGWSVTGVDISEVAVEQARQLARTRRATVHFMIADLDGYDLGRERWDLITSFYMHGWHDRSPTDVPSRIVAALKPGGLLVMEGFARPDVSFGFDAAQLVNAYGRLRVLRADAVTDTAEWDRGNRRQLVRFVAEKVAR